MGYQVVGVLRVPRRNPYLEGQGDLVTRLIMGIIGVNMCQGDLVTRSIMGRIGVNMRVMGVVKLLTKFP